MFFFKSKKNTPLPQEKIETHPEETIEETLPPSFKELGPVEYLQQSIDAQTPLKAMLIDTTAFKNSKSISILNNAATSFLRDFAQQIGGKIFELANSSVLVAFPAQKDDELQALLIRLSFTFDEEMSLAQKSNILETPFFKLYETPASLLNLCDKITHMAPFTTQAPSEPKVNITTKFVSVLGGNKKPLRKLTPLILDKVQKSLQQVDFSNLIRRQAVCAIIGKSAPQMIFEEVFVSIPDLRDTLMPEIDLTSDPWLFLHLTETLDKRVLAHVSQHDDGSLVSNFSLNLNVSTILSDEFLAFDESIPPPLRSSIILELQLVDIFNDVKAYLLAKAFAQYRGYKICIDGITVDKLQYINRANLNSDLMKIIWHPSFLDIINEDSHFRDYVNKAERAKMILCRVDDPKAIEIGNSLGINLYQGRYVQKELNRKHR